MLTRVTTPADTTLATVLAVAAAWETLAAAGPDPRLRAALAALTALGVAMRRRVPSGAAATVAFGMTAESVLTESPDEISVMVTMLVVAYSVAAYAPRRLALAGLALVALGVTVAIALDPSDSPGNIPPSLVIFVVLPGVVGFVVRRKQHDITTLQLEAETLAREADAAVEAERRRIARELHDVVSHAVTLVAVQAEAGQATLDSDPAATRRSLAAIADVSREALAELDRMLSLLREEDGPSDEQAGLARVEALAQGARSAGLAVTVRRTGASERLPAAVDRCAYRVLQEGLTNALRHSAGGHATLTIDTTPDAVRLGVETTGRRHRSAYGGTGRGLVGLRERVAGLGGDLDAGPTEEGGFSLTAVLPLDRAASQPPRDAAQELAP